MYKSPQSIPSKKLLEPLSQAGVLPEWAPQAGVLLVWPHRESDWLAILADAEAQYYELVKAIARFESVFVLCPASEAPALESFSETKYPVSVIPMATNDTWIRDFGPFCYENQYTSEKRLIQFTYNGWGMKYPASLDNQVSSTLFQQGFFSPVVAMPSGSRRFALEGGGIECNGEGLALVNRYWMQAPNRNEGYSEKELKESLKEILGVQTILEVDCPPLEGDDTDGHIDTIVRFVAPRRIAYVAPTDTASPNYLHLLHLEAQVRDLRTPEGLPFDLLPLPDVGILTNSEGEQLPASYANFLFVNGGIILPTYGKEALDQEVLTLFRHSFPEYEVTPVEATTLIQWHGSIHCATMQIATGFL